MSNSWWPPGLQPTTHPILHYLPVCSNSCLLSQRCCLSISTSATLFSFCLQSFPVSGFFLVSRLFTSISQSIGTSASVLPMNIQGWFPLGLIGLISLLYKRLSSLLHSSKASVLWCPALFMVKLSHPYMTTGKTIALTIQTFVGKVMCLLFNMLYSFVINFLSMSNCPSYMTAITLLIVSFTVLKSFSLM